MSTHSLTPINGRVTPFNEGFLSAITSKEATFSPYTNISSGMIHVPNEVNDNSKCCVCKLIGDP